MAVDVRTYGAQARRVGLLTPDPFGTRRATPATLAAALVQPLAFAEGHDDLPCLHVDPEVFFPVVTTGQPAVKAIQEAKQVCRLCPVRLACRQWAMEHREHGVWGGTSEGDRELETGHRPNFRSSGRTI